MYFIQKKISSLLSSSNDSSSSSSITTNLNSNTINSDDNANRIPDHIDHAHVNGSNKIVETDDKYHYYYYNKRQYAIEHTEQLKRQYIELFESTMPVTCAALITSIMAYLFQYIACQYSKQDADVSFDECINIDPIDGISELSYDGQKLLVILTVVYVILSYVFGLVISVKAMDYKRFNKACGCCSHYSSSTSNTNSNNIENIDEANDSRDIKIRKCKNILYDRIKVALTPWQPSNVSSNFFNALAIENFSFATKNLFLQTILYKVLNPEVSFGINYGILSWFGSVGLFVVFLNIEYRILPLLKMTRNKHIQERISAFNSDAFCLCFGYSFTILMLVALQSYPSITRSEVESHNCGEGEDDYEPCSKAQVAQYSYQVPVYLAYTVMVVFLAAIFNEFKDEEEDETERSDSENMTDDRTAFTKFVDCFKEFSSNMKAVQAGAAFFIMYQVILEEQLGSQGAGTYGTLILALAFTYIVPKRMNAWYMNKFRKRKATQVPGLMNCFGFFNEDYNPKFVSNRIILCGRIAKLVLGFSWEEFVFAFFIAVIPNNFGLRLGMIVLVTLVLIVLSSRLQDAFDKYLKSIKKYDKLDNIAIENVVLEL